MDPDKAPGLDGFTARFYISCWDIIKNDLYRMVKKSQICTKLGGSTNTSFFTLIPKEKRAKKFNRFRPISLCNTRYKIHAWGANWLNKAGKVILMNSVLTSLPIYQCSVLLAPKTIINKIDELLRRFLWEGGRNCEKKLHLVSWDKVTKSKMEGGLQIRDCPICEEQFHGLLLCCLDSVMGVLKSASLGYPLWICKCQRGCAHCVRKFAEYISDSAHNN